MCVCVCVCVCVCNREMEGWKRRRGGPQGWRRRADRRCSDTRRLEELLIFSHVPRGHRCVSAFAVFRSLALTNTYTASPLYTQTMTHFTPFQTLFPQNTHSHTLVKRHKSTCGWVSGNVPVLNHKTSPLKKDTNWISLTLRPCFFPPLSLSLSLSH